MRQHLHRPANGKLTIGQGRKLLLRYLAAHDAFSRGDFVTACKGYADLTRALAPHFAAIVRRNLGSELTFDAELTEQQAAEALAGIAPEVVLRLEGAGREAKTAALCSAVAHDAAVIGRHLAEQKEAGRNPDIADAIIRGFAHAIAVNPQNATNYHNLAGYEDYLGRDAAASHHYRLGLQLDQTQWESWVMWGHNLARNGDREGAELCWANAFLFADQIAQLPTGTTPSTLWAVAMLRLLKGDYARGWSDYERRLSFPPYLHRYGRPDLVMPLWDGSPIDGTVYLHAEQGAGDALMLARFIPLVQARASHVIVEVIRGMVTLFQAMFPDVEVVSADDDPPPHHVQLPMFSLPSRFGTTLETIPDPVRFPVCSAGNALILPERGRIGLCWRGSTTHPNDLIRSMPFETLFPLLDLASSDGFTFQSLQFGYETSAPLDALPLGDFLETARQIARCSLVVTVDTSVAHLAGTMGVPTRVLLPHHAEWRWMQDRDDSPWYPSAKLFRQSKPGDWHGLVSRLVDELSTYTIKFE